MRITEAQLRKMIREELLSESEVYFYRDSSGQMMYKDDEGNSGRATRNAPEGQTLNYSQSMPYIANSGGGGRYNVSPSQARRSRYDRPKPSVNQGQLTVLDALLGKKKSNFIQSVRDQVAAGRNLSDKQKKAIRSSLYRVGMKQEAGQFK